MSVLLSPGLDPRTARFRYATRTFKHFAMTGALAAALVIVLIRFLPWWLEAVIAFALPLYMYFVLLDENPVQLQCEKCGKIILSNTPWVCGVCNAVNRDVTEFPFLHQCGASDCNTPPKAYKCHHHNCGVLIFLTKDEQSENYARCYMPERPQISDDSIREEERKQFEHARRIAELNAGIEEFRAKVASLKKQQEGPKIKNAGEQLREKVRAHYEKAMAAEDEADKLLDEARRLYANNPEKLQAAEEAIRHARDQGM